jgi:uncharacterized protein YlzI (FlbEa/FlbD family)
MQCGIINWSKILLVCLVLISCGKSKEDEKLSKEVIEALSLSNHVIEAKAKDNLIKLEIDSRRLESREIAKIWYSKAREIEKLSNTLIELINSLLEKIKKNETTAIEKEDSEMLLESLIEYKQKISLIDKETTIYISNFLSLIYDSATSIEITKKIFYKSFTNSNSLTKLAIFKNRIEISKEMAIEFCSQHYTYHTIIYDDFFRAIAYQNSIHFKPKELLQITAGIGAFTNDVNGKVKINGKEIKLNDEGVAEFRETVPSKTGTYHKTISLQYTKPDGTICSVEKEIIYTVDE